MCTLTYIPSGNKNFYFTSNRDESDERATAAPDVKVIDGIHVLMPTDQKAGGTWIGASTRKRVVNLMNGAFERHKYEPPYRKSRGLVLLDSLIIEDTDDFVLSYDLAGIEPFTMVVVDRVPDLKITELRWDGSRRYVEQMDPGVPALWAATTLYTPEKRKTKADNFQHWLASGEESDHERIIGFHKSEIIDAEYKATLPAKAEHLNTVSITLIKSKPNAFQMDYTDLMKNTEARLELKLD